MTSPAHPSLAPEGTPYSVARYLDDAAEHLRRFIKKKALNLMPYEVCLPDDGVWSHHLYGKAWEREFAIQVAANDIEAPSFLATVSGYVCHYNGGDCHWVEIVALKAQGMPAMLSSVDEILHLLRLACVWRMPHATEPDSKA